MSTDPATAPTADPLKEMVSHAESVWMSLRDFGPQYVERLRQAGQKIYAEAVTNLMGLKLTPAQADDVLWAINTLLSLPVLAVGAAPAAAEALDRERASAEAVLAVYVASGNRRLLDYVRRMTAIVWNVAANIITHGSSLLAQTAIGSLA